MKVWLMPTFACSRTEAAASRHSEARVIDAVLRMAKTE